MQSTLNLLQIFWYYAQFSSNYLAQSHISEAFMTPHSPASNMFHAVNLGAVM